MCRPVGGRQDILKYEDTRRKMQRDAPGLEIKFYRRRDGRRRTLRKKVRPTPTTTTTHSANWRTGGTGKCFSRGFFRNQFSFYGDVNRSGGNFEKRSNTFAMQSRKINMYLDLLLKIFFVSRRELTKKVAGRLV